MSIFERFKSRPDEEPSRSQEAIERAQGDLRRQLLKRTKTIEKITPGQDEGEKDQNSQEKEAA